MKCRSRFLLKELYERRSLSCHNWLRKAFFFIYFFIYLFIYLFIHLFILCHGRWQICSHAARLPQVKKKMAAKNSLSFLCLGSVTQLPLIPWWTLWNTLAKNRHAQLRESQQLEEKLLWNTPTLSLLYLFLLSFCYSCETEELMVLWNSSGTTCSLCWYSHGPFTPSLLSETLVQWAWC